MLEKKDLEQRLAPKQPFFVLKMGHRMYVAIKQHWKPILLLMVLSPLLAEVMSGGTPVLVFFLPWIFVSYVIVLYGFQVLVIREVARRKELGLLGLWCLGLIYAFYNEGLHAKTFFSSFHSPIDIYSTYGLVENIRIPWMLVISFWHGLYAVVYPILFVEYLLPEEANEGWLPLGATWALAILSIALAVLAFFFLRPAENATLHLVHFAFIIATALVLWLVAGKLPGSPRITANTGGGGFSWKLFSGGAILYMLVLLVPQLWAELQITWLLFVLYFALLAIVGVRAISSQKETTRERVIVFALGGEMAQALFSLVLGALSGNIMLLVSSAVFAVIFLAAMMCLRRRASESTPPSRGSAMK